MDFTFDLSQLGDFGPGAMVGNSFILFAVVSLDDILEATESFSNMLTSSNAGVDPSYGIHTMDIIDQNSWSK